jgi:hypothetical protein
MKKNAITLFLFLTLGFTSGWAGTCSSPDENLSLNNGNCSIYLTDLKAEKSEADIYQVCVTHDANLSMFLKNTSQSNKLVYAYGATCSMTPTTIAVNGGKAAFQKDINMTAGECRFLYVLGDSNSETSYDINFYLDGCGGGFSELPAEVTTGRVDAVDNFGSISDYNGPEGNNTRFIKTKVSAKGPYTLDGVHLAEDNTTAVAYPSSGSNYVPLTIIMKLYDEVTGTLRKFVDANGNEIDVVAQIPAGTGDDHAFDTSNEFYIPDGAKKQNRVHMRYIDINKLLDYSGANCPNSSQLNGNMLGIPQCIANSTGSTQDDCVAANGDMSKYAEVFGCIAWERCVNSDAEKPACDPSSYNNTYPSPPYDSAYGCYECTVGAAYTLSKDNFAIRPDKFDANITTAEILIANKATSRQFWASDYPSAFGSVGTYDYNETENDSFEINVSIADATKNCPQPNIGMSPDFMFIHGESNETLFTFDDIGDVNMTVAEINGSEYAIVDSADTPDDERLITPFVVSFRLIPDHFRVIASLSDFGSNFTYLYDMNLYDDYNGSTAALDINITAQGDDNETTVNYMETCYAKDSNVTLQIQGTSITPSGALTTFLYYNPAENNGTLNSGEGNYTLPGGVITALPISNLSASFPSDAADGNGTTLIQYKLNFDRKVNLPVNPFKLKLSNVDVNDTDAVFGTDASPTPDTATFLYGRAHAPRYRVGCTNTPAISTSCDSNPLYIYYEFYSNDTTGTIIDLRNDLAADNLRSKDSFNWFQNPGHVPALDGNVTGSQQKYESEIVQIGNILPSGSRSQVSYRYNGAMGYPYKGTMEVNASNTTPWLVYNRFDTTATGFTFEIEFNAEGAEALMDQNVTSGDGGSVNTSRRIRW